MNRKPFQVDDYALRSSLYLQVIEALKRAKDNDFDLYDMPAATVATDLATYDADLEDAPLESLIRAVEYAQSLHAVQREVCRGRNVKQEALEKALRAILICSSLEEALAQGFTGEEFTIFDAPHFGCLDIVRVEDDTVCGSVAYNGLAAQIQVYLRHNEYRCGNCQNLFVHGSTDVKTQRKFCPHCNNYKSI